MRNLRRMATSLVALALMLAFSSCEKEQVNANKEVSVYFDIASIGQKAAIDIKKDGTVGTQDPKLYPECTTAAASSVVATIDGVEYTINMTLLPNSQTEVIQLNADALNVLTDFVVLDENNDTIYSMPLAGSDEADPLKGNLTSVPMDLDLGAFTKSKIEVDVVCWHPYSHMNLTWAWFEIDYHQLKTICFFGDICTKHFEIFHEEGSPYFGQQYDGYDFAAIFDVLVTNATTGETWVGSNLSYQGLGSALCVTYRDDLQVDEDFWVTIFLHMPTGAPVQIYHEELVDGMFSENGNPNGFGGADGVFTFAVGNCETGNNNNTDADLELPPYVHIPSVVTMKLSDGNFGNHHSYWTAEFTYPGAISYDDIPNGVEIVAFCGDKFTTIGNGTYPNTKLYSSLDPDSFKDLDGDWGDFEWGAINWMANNFTVLPINTSLAQAKSVQNSIWHFTNGITANTWALEAGNHLDYKVPVGGWAVVLCDAPAYGIDKQLILVRVDP